MENTKDKGDEDLYAKLDSAYSSEDDSSEVSQKLLQKIYGV